MQHESFDDFAEGASGFVASPIFFTGCVLLVLLWAPSLIVIRDLDLWQLIINTITTIVTFLMVALLENSNRRTSKATHLKLDRILDALGEIPDTTTEKLSEVVAIEKKIQS